MGDFVPGSALLNSLIGSAAFQSAARQSEMIQNVSTSIQPLLGIGATSNIRDITSSLGGMTSVLAQFNQAPVFDTPEILLNLCKQIDTVYSPISEIAKQVTTISADWAAMGQSVQLLGSLPRIEPKTIEGISKVLELYGSSIQHVISDISVEEFEEICVSDEITPDTVAETIETICTEVAEGRLTISEHWDKFKKTKWYVAFQIVLWMIVFLCKPVTDHLTDKVLETTGITSFWEESGVYDWIDQFFAGLSGNTALSEEAAKASAEQKGGNLSKQKRDDLLSKISAIRSYIAAAPQDENTANLLIYLSDLEKDVDGKKYGLVFEEHQEAIDAVLSEHTPALTEEAELLIDNGGEMNFLLEGDNLAALQLLQKTHRSKIDLIYIDPPYNTGNKDFVYDDCFVDSEDTFHHSKWSSFMSKRLEIAHKLLTEQGAIFIQISDIELAQLRLLCDDIFGEENFLNIISVNMKNIAGASGGGEDKKFKKNCEYIVVYAKNYSSLPLFNGAYEYTEMSALIQQYLDEGKSWKYTSVLVDAGKKEYIGTTVDGDGNDIKVFLRRKPIIKSIKELAKEDSISEKEAYKKYGIKIFQTTNAQSSIRTRIMAYRREREIEEDVISIEYIPKTGKNKGTVYEQFYKGDKCRLFVWLRDTSEVINGELYKKDLQGTYWDFAGSMKNLTKEGNVEFSNGKKPVDLLKRIISLYPNLSATVLDFFAGSGTTGHAVISQNIDDKGTRHFILCTNNQNNICREKTYKRLSNVINGYTNDKGKYFEPMPSSLKYYRIDYVPINEQLYYEYADELLRHVRELVELENGINFTENAEIAIVLTDEELANFIARPETFAKCHTLYLGHGILPTGEQEELLKEQEIVVHIIPDYYYRELEG